MKQIFIYAHFWAIVSFAVAWQNQAAEPRGDSVPPRPGIAAFFSDRVVARGQGFEIRQNEVDEMFVTYKANRAAIGERVPEKDRARVEADILDKLIATRLCVDRATEADKAKAKEIAAQFMAEQLKQAPSEESFKRQLISMGMTPEQFHAQIQEQAIVKAVMDREVKVQKTITDAEARAFYEQKQELFQEPARVHVSHILISTKNPATGLDLSAEQRLDKKRFAERIWARAKAGEDFSKLAQEFSDDAASKGRGGEYVFTRANEIVPPEFKAAAFSLAPNQISDLVATRAGFHVIKLHEKTPTRTTDYSAVEAQIKEILLDEEVQKELPQYLENLKKAAGVEILVQRP